MTETHSHAGPGGSVLSRRRMVPVGVLGGGAVAAGVMLGEGVAGSLAEAAGGRSLVVDIDVDLRGLQLTVGDAGAFDLRGEIFEPGDIGVGDPIGTYACWGTLPDGAGAGRTPAVSQEYNLAGRGKIQVQGVESFKGLTGFPPFADAEEPGIRAVVGGTGDFRRVRGDGEFEILAGPDFGSGLLEFQARFNLIS